MTEAVHTTAVVEPECPDGYGPGVMVDQRRCPAFAVTMVGCVLWFVFGIGSYSPILRRCAQIHLSRDLFAIQNVVEDIQ